MAQPHQGYSKLKEKDNGELSVDVKSLTTPEKSIGDQLNLIPFEISNLSVLGIEKLSTLHDRLIDGSNYAHAVILGMTLEAEISPGILARKSKRVYL